MADKKIEKALYGPSVTEVALGAILGLLAGLAAAAVYLVFRPVLQVKELPKEPVRGAIYYIPGSDLKAKSQGWSAKQKQFVGGTSVQLSEEELNAWSTTTFGATAPATPKPAGKGTEPAKDAAAPKYDGIFNPGTPNFKITGDTLQIGFKCVLNWYGLTHEVIVVSTGTIEPEGDDFVYVPKTLHLGSCPLQMIPGAMQPLWNHLVGKKTVPDEIKSAWAKMKDAKVEGGAVKLTMQ